MDSPAHQDLDTSLGFEAADEIPQSSRKKKISYNIQECLEILDKPETTRTTLQEQRFAEILIGLGIFDRATFGNLEPHAFLQKLLPIIKHEVYLPGEPIVHYNQVEEKMCIIISGTAKEFIAKSGKDMEKETHKKYSQRKNVPKTMVDLTELDSKIKRIDTFDESNKPHLSRGNTLGHKRTRSNPKIHTKSKTLLNGNTISLNSLENIGSGTYNSIPDQANMNPVTLPQIPAYSEDDEEEEDLIESAMLREDDYGVDEELLRHLRKHPKTYFVGDTLKIKYSRTIGTGNYFGRRAINKKSLSKQMIVAEDECHCIVLHKDDYLMALEAEKNLHLDKINFFKQMFPQIDAELVTEFSLLWDKESYKRSDVIYQEKDSSNKLFVVFEGEIIISKEVTDYFKSKLQSEGKKKDSYTFQVATLCHGYFFGEEFFKRRPREFTVTTSSSKAKVLQLSKKDYKLLGRKYFEIFSSIQEMVQLSYKLNVDLLENLYQAHGVEVSRQATHQDYIDRKEQLLKAETTTDRKDVLSGPKQFVKPSKKAKNINIRLQYDRYFVCKPGQKHPEYLKVMFTPKTEASKVMPSDVLVASKRRSSSVEDQENFEENLNFVKPSSLKKVPSGIYIGKFKSEETREFTTNEGSLSTLRGVQPFETDEIMPTKPSGGKKKTQAKNTRSVSFIPTGSLDSIYSENEKQQNQIQEEDQDNEEGELLANTSEMVPLDLQNVRSSYGSGNESLYTKKAVRSLESSLQNKLLRSSERNATARLGKSANSEFNPIMISVASSNVYSNNVSITPKTSINKQMPHTQRGIFTTAVAKSLNTITNISSVTTRSIMFDKEKANGKEGIHLPAIKKPEKKIVGSLKDLNEISRGLSARPKMMSNAGKLGSHRKLVLTMKGK